MQRMNPSEKEWRTLIRVIRHDEDNLYVILPCFDPHQEVVLPKADIPEYALNVIENEIDEKGVYRFHIQCNIGAENAEDLTFSAPWEIDEQMDN